MDVIGRTAFGIHTDSQNNPNDPLLRFSKVLLENNDIRNPLAILANQCERESPLDEFDAMWKVVLTW
ncbi:hypothetical protein TNCV_3407631 [Trichonephila clavipes]|nr:hypothetical protein TNCV_3407631 [Trichonephila clavipes]